MIHLSDISVGSREPMYLQIIAQVKRKILSGEYVDGDSLPSRRELAALLGVNPNTVQKAFKILEDEGLVVTPRNAASVLRVTPEIKQKITDELNHAFVQAFVTQAKENRLSYKRVIELISTYWGEDP